ncbi:MAG TPA: hypothetical protein IAB97_02590 [Candidatus Choladousia intestinipullorum]|nr:hypothetical protein [Candidatus Choladousia intestinipullorum]
MGKKSPHIRLRRILGTIAFLITGILIFAGISEIMRRKTAEEVDMVHSFYEIEEDSLDVLFLGSSHLYYGVQPNELWREYGITSYVMGSPEQTAATSYFLLKEAFTRQQPKVVVMESYYLWNKLMYNGESRLRQAFDGMKFGPVKVEMINEMLPDAGFKEKLTYYLPFLKYHSRWSELESYDFTTKPFLKGSRLDYTTVELEDPGIPKKAAAIPDNSMEYLEKIIRLCEENDAEFVMAAIPFGIETDQKRYKRRQGLNLTLEEYLQAEGIPFLFYQRDYPDIIDFSTDFRDKTHLNTNGAVKLTHHLGGWLKENYGLEGHKGEAAYESWDSDLVLYDRETEWVKENPPEAGA